MSSDTFSKGVIATTFMPGVIEFYAKHFLGFPQYATTKEQWAKQNELREVFISPAILRLKKCNTDLARVLNRIDKQSSKRLQEFYKQEDDRTKAKIADRLATFRNKMVHGEQHHFHDKGKYLVMLYILFHLHEQKKADKVFG